MNYDQLQNIASQMVQKGRGILAADESTPTCTKRFEALGIESTEYNRNFYRDLLITTNGMEEFISGVILYEETLFQSTISNAISFPNYLIEKGVIPGIKVDAGAKNFALHKEEKITEGLDGLRDKLLKYYKLGARFAKWRAVITIGENIPTDKKSDVSALSADEKKVYDLVIKRFLSVFMEVCLKDHTEIITLFGKHTCKTTGTVIKQYGRAAGLIHREYVARFWCYGMKSTSQYDTRV